MLPQLLNPIDEAGIEGLRKDPGWWTKEKFDGKRILMRPSGNEVTGINRSALPAGLLGVREDLAHKDCTIDQLKLKAVEEDQP